MHIPPAFSEQDPAVLGKLVADNPLCTLCVVSDNGLLVNHVPMLWVADELHGHVAMNNELVQALNQPLQATAVFHGPEGYISPSDYPSKAEHGKVVPTWNYAVAHFSGSLALKRDPGWIRAQVDRLTAHNESRHGDGSTAIGHWTLDDAPAAFAEGLLRSILGIVLNVEAVTGKFKLSQNRPAADRAGAIEGARARGEKSLAGLMQGQR